MILENDILSTERAQIFYENDPAYCRRVTAADAEEFNDPTDAIYKLRKEIGGLFESML